MSFPSMSGMGDTVIEADDTASINAVGAYDYVVATDNLGISASTQTDVASLREELVNEYLQVLSQPRQQITFVPTVDCNVDYTADYEVGDLVTARAYDVVTKTWRFNGLTRVYGVSFQIDDNDAEACSLTLIPSTGGSGAG